MHKETINYVDYNGTERSEDFYFNMNKAEVIKWATNKDNAYLPQTIQRLINEGDLGSLYDIYTDLVKQSYGVKSDDGKVFVKDPEIVQRFIYSEAYSVLFTKMVSDPEYIITFMTNVMPKDVQEEMIKEINKHTTDGAAQDLLQPAT